MHVASPLEGALSAALVEYARSPKEFVRRHGRGRTTHVIVHRARRYDAVAVEHFLRERVGRVEIGGWSHRSDRTPLLDEAGVEVIDLDAWGVDFERTWRLKAWNELLRHDCVVPADWLRARGLYGGAQGVWVDANRTRSIEGPGVAVSVLHTGRHYADDLDDQRIVYNYPRTDRAGLRDANEVDSVRNARELHLPLFVVSETAGGSMRLVRLAWVIADDPESRTFLMEFADAEPAQLEEHDPPVDAPFARSAPRARTTLQIARLERDATFKFRLLRRYEGRCAITGVDVDAVLDGAHVIDVRHGGTDDARNGLLLTADLHRAMDAQLWALHPETLRIVTRPQGPSLDDLQVDADRLRPGARPPHPSAVEWRFKRFLDLLGEPHRRSVEAVG